MKLAQSRILFTGAGQCCVDRNFLQQKGSSRGGFPAGRKIDGVVVIGGDGSLKGRRPWEDRRCNCRNPGTLTMIFPSRIIL